jgi:hypothetical protein
MKKLLFSALFAGAATMGVYAQGTINVDNTANANPSSTATSGGLVFSQASPSSTPVLFPATGSFSVEVLGGASSSSLTPIVTLTGAQVFNYGGGIFGDASGGTYIVPGVAGSATATLEVEAWTGNFASYAAAVTGGAEVGNVIFQNPTGGGGVPIATPSDLTGMPALILTPSPEPSTIALGGLGAAALMFFRRRNK